MQPVDLMIEHRAWPISSCRPSTRSRPVVCSKADNTTTIAKAEAAVSAVGDGILRFPPGTCVTKSTITMNSNVMYRAAAANIAIVKLADNANMPVFQGEGIGSLAGPDTRARGHGFTFRDLTIDGNSGHNL
jgi:hypothetical protein